MPFLCFIIKAKEGDGVKTVIYADVLVAVNIYVTYFLIVAVRLLLKRQTKGIFVAAASVMGGLSALVVLFDVKSVALSVVIKLVASGVITTIAFLPARLSEFFKTYIAFFSVNFIFGGVMLFFECTFHPRGMTFINGTVYFDVSVLFIAVMSVACYGVVLLLDRVLKKRAAEKTLYNVTVVFRGKRIYLKALYDTGNSLSDPVDKRPVAVASLDALKKLFCDEEYAFLKKFDFSSTPPETLKGLTRIIAGKSVCGSSLFWAFVPERLYISDGKTVCFTDFAAIAVTDGSLFDGEYSVLLCNSIFEGSKKTDEVEVGKNQRPYF